MDLSAYLVTSAADISFGYSPFVLHCWHYYPLFLVIFFLFINIFWLRTFWPTLSVNMLHIATSSNVRNDFRKGNQQSIADNSPCISLYLEPPQQELTLDEFELVSLHRLQLLRSIEVLKTGKGLTEGHPQFYQQVFEVSIT